MIIVFHQSVITKVSLFCRYIPSLAVGEMNFSIIAVIVSDMHSLQVTMLVKLHMVNYDIMGEARHHRQTLYRPGALQNKT